MSQRRHSLVLLSFVNLNVCISFKNAENLSCYLINRLCVFPCWLIGASYILALFTFSFLRPFFPLTSLFENAAFKFKSSFPCALSHLLPVFSNILLALLIRLFTPSKWKSQWSLVLRLHLCSDQICCANLAAVPVWFAGSHRTSQRDHYFEILLHQFSFFGVSCRRVNLLLWWWHVSLLFHVSSVLGYTPFLVGRYSNRERAPRVAVC